MATPEFRVESGDATSLDVFVDGDGPPLVMVHGSIADHTTFDDLVTELAPSFSVYRMDRRGFGASGDAGTYAIEREYDDVAAVVDAVSDRWGVDVALFGHSYGATCALGGAVATDHVERLVLFEPSLGLTYPDGCIESIEAALEQGDRDAAIVEVLSTILQMTPDEIDQYRQSPSWPERFRAAHTIPSRVSGGTGPLVRPDQLGRGMSDARDDRISDDGRAGGDRARGAGVDRGGRALRHRRPRPHGAPGSPGCRGRSTFEHSSEGERRPRPRRVRRQRP